MRVAPVAEEQPGAARRPGRAALLRKGAERGDARAGPDHDDVGIRLRQAEMAVRLEARPHRPAALQAVGDEGRGDPAPRPAVGLVADGRDEEVRLVADLFPRGGDRVGARRERAGDGLTSWSAASVAGNASKRSMSWRPSTKARAAPSSTSRRASAWPVALAKRSIVGTESVVMSRSVRRRARKRVVGGRGRRPLEHVVDERWDHSRGRVSSESPGS